jgi:hypothetical protein
MPSISVGQGNNILGAGSVAMPKYDNGSLSFDQYPCSFVNPDEFKRPNAIPLGSYDHFRNTYQMPNPSATMFSNVTTEANPPESDLMMKYEQPWSSDPFSIREDYDPDTQHKNAGEFSDLQIFIFSSCLLLVLIICTYLSFRMK